MKHMLKHSVTALMRNAVGVGLRWQHAWEGVLLISYSVCVRVFKATRFMKFIVVCQSKSRAETKNSWKYQKFQKKEAELH